jgi:hypothetical protein
MFSYFRLHREHIGNNLIGIVKFSSAINTLIVTRIFSLLVRLLIPPDTHAMMVP